ncbi:FUSC family protein [Shewanella sp. 10N.286.54.B9]|uniref:FUSC family protein n=1 Tax=Shewanella sp. 10N.286.54.B9 TaxID=3229719 RepID=UPI00354B6940
MALSPSKTSNWRWLIPDFTNVEIMAGIRMGLALSGCTLTAMYLDLESPAWATTTALLITLIGSFGGVIDRGLSRLKGTLLAVPLGILAYNYLINDPWLFSFGVAFVTAALILPSLLRKNNERYIFNVTCSTFILIAINGLLVSDSQDMLQTIANRVSEVSLGILFSFLATLGTKPNYEVKKLYTQLEKLTQITKDTIKDNRYQLDILQALETLVPASIESVKIGFHANSLELALSKLLLAAELSATSDTVSLSAASQLLLDEKVDRLIKDYRVAYKELMSSRKIPKTSNRRLKSLTPTNWQIVVFAASRVFWVISFSLLYWYFSGFQSAPAALMLGCIFISIFSTQIGFTKQLKKFLIAAILGSSLGFLFANNLFLAIPIWQWLFVILFGAGFVSGVLLTRAGPQTPIVLFGTVFFLSALGLNNLAIFDPLTSFNNALVHLVTALQLWLGFMLIPEPSQEYIAKLSIASIQKNTVNAVHNKIVKPSKYFVVQMQRRLQISQLQGFDIGRQRKQLCNIETTKGILALRANEKLVSVGLNMANLLDQFDSPEKAAEYLQQLDNTKIDDLEQLVATVVCFFELQQWRQELAAAESIS